MQAAFACVDFREFWPVWLSIVRTDFLPKPPAPRRYCAPGLVTVWRRSWKYHCAVGRDGIFINAPIRKGLWERVPMQGSSYGSARWLCCLARPPCQTPGLYPGMVDGASDFCLSAPLDPHCNIPQAIWQPPYHQQGYIPNNGVACMDTKVQSKHSKDGTHPCLPASEGGGTP